MIALPAIPKRSKRCIDNPPWSKEPDKFTYNGRKVRHVLKDRVRANNIEFAILEQIEVLQVALKKFDRGTGIS